MDPRLDRLRSRLPGWESATVTALSGGITNQNFRCDVAGEPFVVRIGGQGTAPLGIDRRREYVCATIAATIGVGAEVVQWFPEDDVLVTRFIEGRVLTAEDAENSDLLPRVVASIRRCHAGPAFPGVFSPFETVTEYHREAVRHGVDFPPSIADALALCRRIQTAIGPSPALRPCHNDLLAANFIDDGTTVRIIDWEYAAMGDPFFDLGNFAINHDLDDARCGELLRIYQGDVRTRDIAHLHLMRLASDLREALWAFLQSGISTLPVDYRAYALRHLERFLTHASPPRLPLWLADVGNPSCETRP